MKIQRIITAEGKSGVATRVDTIDTATIDFLTNIWGFDQVPHLPLSPEQVLGEYQRMGMFGPLGGVRVDLFTIAPETGDGPSELERAAALDMGTPGMVPGKEGDGMHRTDSIDITVVVDGETNVGYPGEDGLVHELTIKTGDVLVHNGTFHSWHNRSTKNCSILFIVLAAERKAP
jgi:hypothetical protein